MNSKSALGWIMWVPDLEAALVTASTAILASICRKCDTKSVGPLTHSEINAVEPGPYFSHVLWKSRVQFDLMRIFLPAR